MREVVRLGPFQLHGPLAEGGMGVVWRGVHEKVRVPVAVKVLAPHAWHRADLLEQFRNEVRAVARLDHPGIVMVLDHGTVSMDASTASEGRLSVGSPYLVMEYASGGSLSEIGRPLSWDEMRSVLLALLDALAHAHARGVVHRDIKPGNILLCTAGDLRPGIKLTDWGIAHALSWGRGRQATERAGTLHFMAPEQIRGDWRHQGPWTDLYALGCLAYRLAVGRLPFAGLRGDALAEAHRNQTPAQMRARVPVGGGFAAWVECMMAKSPADRFTRAADAARALAALSPPPERPSLLSGTPSLMGSRLVVPDGTTLTSHEDVFSTLSRSGPLVPSYGTGIAIQGSAAGVPKQWRTPSPPAPVPELVGAGLGLWGLRTIPLVGRIEERDALWAALYEVEKEAGARAVILEGPSGLGKSALARWLSERAHEVGGAVVVRAVQGEGESADAGLRRALARALRVDGLRGQTLRARLQEEVPAAEVDAVFRILTDEDDDPSPLARRLRARERRSTLTNILRRHGAGHPVLLILEDAQWSHEALGLARDVLQAQIDAPFPILVVVTVRTESLATRRVERDDLAELKRDPRVQTLAIEALDPSSHVHLIRQLLDLDAALVARVEQLTAGSPLFVIQLVDEWVRRGLLRPGESGLTLQAGAPKLPDDLHATWARQAEEVLYGLPSVARYALERASILGVVVDGREWTDICAVDVHEVDTTDTRAARDVLRQRLIERRLAREDGSGLAFSHPMFRQAVNRLARERGRYARHHAAAAKMLRARYPKAHGEMAERIGLHALEAGDVEQAFEPLLAAVQERRHRANYRAALALVQELEQAADQANMPKADPRRGELALAACTLHRLQGDYRGAAARAEKLRVQAVKLGWPDKELAAMLELATVHLHTNRLEDGSALAEEVVRRSAPVSALRASALYTLAAAAGDARDFEKQDALHRAAASAYRQLGDDVGLADCERDRGNHALRQGDVDRAKPHLEAALKLYEERGLRLGLAHTLNGLAEIARKAGKLDEAEAGYERSVKLFQAIGGGQATVPMLNLGLVRLERGDMVGARSVVEQALERLLRQGRKGFIAAAHSLLLPTYADAGDWSDWDRAFAAVKALLEESKLVAHDVAWAFELASVVAHRQGDVRRSRQVRRMARQQYQALGDTMAVQRLVQPL
ncbi:MAG: protein kinase [Proteobacteria bacterium]|nr:protein kinase [Pseudomonadota bacterium]